MTSDAELNLGLARTRGTGGANIPRLDPQTTVNLTTVPRLQPQAQEAAIQAAGARFETAGRNRQIAQSEFNKQIETMQAEQKISAEEKLSRLMVEFDERNRILQNTLEDPTKISESSVELFEEMTGGLRENEDFTPFQQDYLQRRVVQQKNSVASNASAVEFQARREHAALAAENILKYTNLRVDGNPAIMEDAIMSIESLIEEEVGGNLDRASVQKLSQNAKENIAFTAFRSTLRESPALAEKQLEDGRFSKFFTAEQKDRALRSVEAEFTALDREVIQESKLAIGNLTQGFPPDRETIIDLKSRARGEAAIKEVNRLERFTNELSGFNRLSLQNQSSSIQKLTSLAQNQKPEKRAETISILNAQKEIFVNKRQAIDEGNALAYYSRAGVARIPPLNPANPEEFSASIEERRSAVERIAAIEGFKPPVMDSGELREIEGFFEKSGVDEQLQVLEAFSQSLTEEELQSVIPNISGDTAFSVAAVNMKDGSNAARNVTRRISEGINILNENPNAAVPGEKELASIIRKQLGARAEVISQNPAQMDKLIKAYRAIAAFELLKPGGPHPNTAQEAKLELDDTDFIGNSLSEQIIEDIVGPEVSIALPNEFDSRRAFRPGGVGVLPEILGTASRAVFKNSQPVLSFRRNTGEWMRSGDFKKIMRSINESDLLNENIAGDLPKFQNQNGELETVPIDDVRRATLRNAGIGTYILTNRHSGQDFLDVDGNPYLINLKNLSKYKTDFLDSGIIETPRAQ